MHISFFFFLGSLGRSGNEGSIPIRTVSHACLISATYITSISVIRNVLDWT